MADTTINGVSVPFLPVGGVDGLKQKPSIPLPVEQSFDTILQKELGDVKFSKHAQERLSERNINLDQKDLKNLNNAITLAEKKGANDSLVFLRDMAFIVSIKNKTIVTAMQGENMRDNVFTNIDSAVVAG
jgi:flagellar operon protein